MALNVKLSQAGHDVKTAEEKDLILGQWNTFKIKDIGFASIEGAPGRYFDGDFWYPTYTSTTVTHNYGYIPVFLAFAEFSTHPGKWVMNENEIVLPVIALLASSTTTQFTFTVKNWMSGTLSLARIIYYIFADKNE